MAELFGTTTRHWRAYADYSVKASDSAVTVDVSAAGFQSVGWGFQLEWGVSTEIKLAGQESATGSGGAWSATGETKKSSLAKKTWTVPRDTVDKTLSLSVTTVNATGYMDGTSTGSVVVTVPALESWKVTYDANGGSGAPAAQSKYRGVELALSGAVPVRSGHTFRGWAVSAGSTKADYQPGASYAGDAELRLFAVWTVDYVPPSVSGFRVYRCDAFGVAAVEGTYVRVTCDWATNQGENATSVKVEYKPVSGKSWTVGYEHSPAARSGRLAQTVGAGKVAVGSAYDVRMTVADPGGSTVATASVTHAFVTFDVGNGGKSVGVGRFASDSAEGMVVAMPTTLEDDLTVAGHLVAGGQTLNADQLGRLLHGPSSVSATSGFPSGVEGKVEAWRSGAVVTLYANLSFTGTVAVWRDVLPSSVQKWLFQQWRKDSDGEIIIPVYSSPQDCWVLSLNADQGRAYLWDTSFGHKSGQTFAGAATFALRV